MNTNAPSFFVTWPNYLTKISNGYTAFQQREEFVDMTLAADGHYVKVHQFIVALASSYLKEIIKSVPARHPVIFLNNVSYSNLCHILEYIYTGEARVPKHQLEDFLKSAEALKLEGISKAAVAVESKITLNEPSVCAEPPLPDTADNLDISSELERRMSFVDNTVITLNEPGVCAEPPPSDTATSLDISSELERRMSFVNDTVGNSPEVVDIITAELIKNASRPTEEPMCVGTEPTNYNSETHQQEDSLSTKQIDQSILDKDYNETEVHNITDQTEQPDYCIDNTINDQSMEQDRASQITTSDSDTETTSSKVRTGTIGTIGKKKIELKQKAAYSLRSQKKPGPKSLPQSKVSKSFGTADTSKYYGTADMSSIVIETNVKGHLLAANRASTCDVTSDTLVTYGNLMPPLKYGPIKTKGSSGYSENSLPQLFLGTGFDTRNAQNQESQPSVTITNEPYAGGQTNYSSTIPAVMPNVTKQMPQIILAPNAPPIITQTDHEAVPSTSAQDGADAREFNNLINKDLKEKTALIAQFKVGSPQQMYTISNQGSVQMILNRFMYYTHYKAFGGRKRRWRCVDYRRNQCLAYLDTDSEVVVKRVNKHSHAFHDDRIVGKMQNSLVFSSIKSAMARARKSALAGPTESSENIE